MIDHAVRIFEAMPSLGCRRSERSICTLLSSFLKNGHVDRSVEEHSIAPGMTISSSKLNVLATRWKKHLLRLMKCLKKDSSPTLSDITLIVTLGAKGKSFQDQELLNVMRPNEIYPNRFSLNTLIDGFCKERNVDSTMECLIEKEEFQKAVGICDQCLNKKWAPPFDTVKGLIDGSVKSSQLDEAKEIIASVRRGIIKGDAKDAWKKFEEGFAS
ncbi:hypothetical protein ZIOFF_030632 [Zingiber officinale]|uniref:Pentatricopeptide repeat-containing protein n=1 Tax=Zingiber officinale TaxID=94328 RepID=A0A8J5GYC1_ZINOF|nr:hypothetical protein ZIOFF_030632 [Zingiber officinale]